MNTQNINSIAHKAAEEASSQISIMRNRALKGDESIDSQQISIIQSAIEEATRELSRTCFDLTEEIAELRSLEPDDTKRLADLLELAWGIIANAGGGDWEKESKEWQGAAEKWRDDYHASMKKGKK